MPIHHAVLALLDQHESYGYELRGEFTEAIGPQWGELNIGHLYQVLDRLVRDGLITKREVRQTVRPDKHLYALTEAGRTELDSWLETPFVRQTGYRDDFFLKLLAASRLGPERFATVLRIQRDAYLAELAGLSELRKEHPDEPLVALLIDAAIGHTKANLEIVDQAEKNQTRLTAIRPAAGERSVRRRKSTAA